jgi:hypothetical protein
MDHNFYKDSISLEVATEKLRKGIAKGLYGPLYKLRMLQFNPTIISIAADQFQFVMFKHHGIFHAQISSEIAAHWGIKPPPTKNCL